MGEYMAIAGRFRGDQLALLLDEMAATADGQSCAEWGVAYCHGTLLEILRGVSRALSSEREASGVLGQPDAGPDPSSRKVDDSRATQRGLQPAGPEARAVSRTDFGGLREIKTDVAIAYLSFAGEPVSRQPLLRREAVRSQAFCAPGRLKDPHALSIGQRFTRTDDPVERFFLHVVDSCEEGDPISSVTAMHERLAGEPDQRFMLLNTKRLVVSTWCAGAVPAQATPLGGAGEHQPEEPVLWLGRAAQVRVLAPRRLAAAGDMKWEPLPASTVLAFARRRYEAGQPD
ncbi:MAG TPA: hypothetical protein ENN51_01420 [candidate division WOR-3 bacterium]|uniref:Uncharacterized protein n=1 Tax=candidate division WOR-3 bacterium TaxID=2052148 RepID=A0A7V0T4T5_UNCW3|nr:hypothetical protein [candidate division WOR-3 bacterium]